MVKSKKGSMKGWTLWQWFKGNWKTLKEIGKLAIPLIIGAEYLNNPSLVGLVTFGGKLLFDSIEYYYTKYN
jgi:hypothetical protein